MKTTSAHTTRSSALRAAAAALFVFVGLAMLAPATHAQTDATSVVRAYNKDSEGTGGGSPPTGGYQSLPGGGADTSFTFTGGTVRAYNKDSEGTGGGSPPVGGYQGLPGGGVDTTFADTSFTFTGGVVAYNKDSEGTGGGSPPTGGYQSLPGGGVDTTVTGGADTTFAYGSYSRVAGPAKAELGGNAPNPFRSSTAITFTLPDQQRVRLAVYNLLGQRVAVLAEGTLAAGRHTASFSAAGLPSGVYVYRLEAESGSSSRRMTLTH